MPRYPLQPLAKLTIEQMRVVLKRVFEREAKLTPKVAGQIMHGIEPPVEREMGSLIKKRALGGGRSEEAVFPEILPIAEARAKYFSDPEQYIPGRGGSSAKVLTQPIGAGEAGLSPEDLAQKIGYERQRFRSIIPSGTQQAVGVIRGESGAAEKEALMRRAGLTLEDIKPGVKPEQVLAEKGIQTGGEVPPVGEIVQTALIADSLWKDIGGGRSVDGKWWGELRNAARGGVKQHFETARDYFISSFYNWKKDPVKFRKNFPRETRLIEKAEKKFNESVEGTLTGVE